MSAVTMVTDQLTVPCDSLSNLYSQLCFSPRMVMPNMVVILQYTVRAMQRNTRSTSAVVESCSISVSHYSKKYALL